MKSIYETEKLLAEYLLFHFGRPDEILPPGREWPDALWESLDFPRRTVGLFSKVRARRALDLGCAVGGSTFELAKSNDEVIGIDFSQRFIHAAEALRQGGQLNYQRLDEGLMGKDLVARAPLDVDTTSVRFIRGDAMELPNELGNFDRVHAANLLCRLPEPQRLLNRLPQLVVPDGELVLATPCTWLEEFTPREFWPEGTTFDWLRDSLTPAFRLLRQVEEPFLIRETARKFQWSTALVTLWQRLG